MDRDPRSWERGIKPNGTLSPPEKICFNICSDESHSSVSLTVRDKVTRQCPQSQILNREASQSEESNQRGLLASLMFYRWARSAYVVGLLLLLLWLSSLSLSLSLLACLPACLPDCLPACLPVCLSVCLSLSLSLWLFPAHKYHIEQN